MSFALSNHQLVLPDFSIITIHHGSGEKDDPLLSSLASLINQQSVKSEELLEHLGGESFLWNKISKEIQLSEHASHYTLRLLEEKNITAHEGFARALARVRGNIVGFLQPGEEYLPGALIAVEKYFQAHREVDLLLAGAIVEDEAAGKTFSYAPQVFSLEYFWTVRPRIIASTLFGRASLFTKDFLLDPTYGELMLEEWLLRVLQAGKRMAPLHFNTTRTRGSSLKKQEDRPLPSPPTWMKLLLPWWKFCSFYQTQFKKK